MWSLSAESGFFFLNRGAILHCCCLDNSLQLFSFLSLESYASTLLRASSDGVLTCASVWAAPGGCGWCSRIFNAQQVHAGSRRKPDHECFIIATSVEKEYCFVFECMSPGMHSGSGFVPDGFPPETKNKRALLA